MESQEVAEEIHYVGGLYRRPVRGAFLKDDGLFLDIELVRTRVNASCKPPSVLDSQVVLNLNLLNTHATLVHSYLTHR